MKKKDKEKWKGKDRMPRKRWKWCIPGYIGLSAILFLCIPAMAGGYSAKSELKINVIGLHPCSEEQGLMEDEGMFEREEEQKQPEDEWLNATKSNATKSDASSTKKYMQNTNLPGKRENKASVSDAKTVNAKAPNRGQYKEEGTEEIIKASVSDAELQEF